MATYLTGSALKARLAADAAIEARYLAADTEAAYGAAQDAAGAEGGLPDLRP